jgi:hypothetical protein
VCFGIDRVPDKMFVQTGKYRKDTTERAIINPDRIIPTIADLTEIV